MTEQVLIERRTEPRSEVGLAIQVNGIDTRGNTFLQEAHASNVSLGGALISQLEVEVRTGDVIALTYAGKKARYRVVWVRHGGVRYKYQAVVQRLDPDECPWQNLLSEEPGVVPSPEASRPVTASVSRAD
jgi:PilZ domain